MHNRFQWTCVTKNKQTKNEVETVTKWFKNVVATRAKATFQNNNNNVRNLLKKGWQNLYQA